jgi:PAS domain S-box-containing protein
MNTNRRASGIEALGDMDWGSHLCMFYETEQDLLEVLGLYFKPGLVNNEFCLWITSDASTEKARHALRQVIPSADQHLEKGDIEILSGQQWYGENDEFDATRVIQASEAKLSQALEKGYTRMKALADEAWLDQGHWKLFSDYEGTLDEHFAGKPISILCAYPTASHSVAEILDIARTHRFIAAKRNGIWEVLEAPELKHAKAESEGLDAELAAQGSEQKKFDSLEGPSVIWRTEHRLQKARDELEEKVQERTAKLRQVNQALQVEIIEQKRTQDALRTHEYRLQAAIDAADIVLWERELSSGHITWLGHHEKLLGFAPGELDDNTLASFEKRVHPEDVEGLRRIRQRALEERSEYSHEYRVVWQDDSIHWLRAQGRFIYNEAGQPVRLYGAVLDITERKQAEEALRKSERVLREAESLGHTGSWEQDLVTGEIFNTEENLRLFFGDDRSKGADLEDYAQVVHPDDREYVLRRRAELIDQEGPGDIEYRVVWPDGSVHMIFGRATVVRDELGQPIRVYGTNVDITERKSAEEEIRRYAARMEALVEISRTFAKAGLDYQSILNTVARRTAEIIGDACVITLFSDDAQRSFPVAFHHPDAKALSMMHEALMHTWQDGTDTQRYQALLAGDSIYIPFVNPEEFQASLEPEFWTFFEAIGISSVLIVPLKTDGHVIGTLGITRDRRRSPYTYDDQALLQNIADRAAMSIENARLFDQVQGAREQLEALSRRILEVQEAERRALTTELHDRVGQNLTGLSINLQNMKALLSGEEARKLASKFDDAQALVQDTTRQIRDIMAELHLPELEDYGLAAALETYTERAASRGNLELSADLPDLAPLHSDVRIALFRAAQEAISNVLKRANATQLEIRLEEQAGRIRLRIEDNGQGFAADLESQKEARTWGLQIMRERIESIGGRVQIESEPGHGTRVTFEIERPS